MAQPLRLSVIALADDPDATGWRSRVGPNQAITTAPTGATSGCHTHAGRHQEPWRHGLVDDVRSRKGGPDRWSVKWSATISRRLAAEVTRDRPIWVWLVATIPAIRLPPNPLRIKVSNTRPGEWSCLRVRARSVAASDSSRIPEWVASRGIVSRLASYQCSAALDHASMLASILFRSRSGLPEISGLTSTCVSNSRPRRSIALWLTAMGTATWGDRLGLPRPISAVAADHCRNAVSNDVAA